MQITKEVMDWILFIACSMGSIVACVIAHQLWNPESWTEPNRKIYKKRWK